MDWKRILEIGEGAERDREMAQAMKQAPYLEGEELRNEMRRLIEAEYALDDDDLRDASRARLKAVLALDDTGARKVADAYDSVMEEMSGDVAFRRAALVQSLARMEFSVEDETRLRALLPNVFGEKPAEVSVGTPGPQEPLEPYPRRRWGMFWRRKKAETSR